MNNNQPSWPEDVLARYQTVGGANVDVTHTSHSGYVTSTCTGCTEHEDTPTDGHASDTPEESTWRVDRVLPAARAWAQSHAEKCRAMPRPDGAR